MPEITPLPGPRYVGIGFSKTGTSTLGECFEILGLGPVCSPRAVSELALRRNGGSESNAGDPRFRYREWDRFLERTVNRGETDTALELAKGFRCFHDRPWSLASVYPRLDTTFPGSKFILTIRDPEDWWRSVNHWLGVTHGDKPGKLGRYLTLLGADKLDKDQFIDGYRQHNETARRHFRGRPGSFLEINFEDGEGWRELCEFLRRPVPSRPLPHANRRPGDALD